MLWQTYRQWFAKCVVFVLCLLPSSPRSSPLPDWNPRPPRCYFITVDINKRNKQWCVPDCNRWRYDAGFSGVVFRRIPRVLAVPRSRWIGRSTTGLRLVNSTTQILTLLLLFCFTGSRKACSCYRRRGKNNLSWPWQGQIPLFHCRNLAVTLWRELSRFRHLRSFTWKQGICGSPDPEYTVTNFLFTHHGPFMILFL